MRHNHPAPNALLRSLYDALPATDSSHLTHIILKDLHPLLYATPATSTSHALLDYDTNSKQVLTREQSTKARNPSGSMVKMYRVCARLNEAAMGFETPAAETKYDGERAQIHAHFSEDGIAIFSKSKWGSTLDRIAVHLIVKEALAGLGGQGIILDAEMVAFSDERNAIDDQVLADTWSHRAYSAPQSTFLFLKTVYQISRAISHSYSSSSASTLHLALVFFDVLLIGNASLLNTPYTMRRSVLESVVHEIPGHTVIAEHTLVSNGSDLGMGYRDTIDLVVVAASRDKDGASLSEGAPFRIFE
ncbi:hypothetical protein BU15DRAFT_71023 [Melanogaster broomeanus]|nr:hypothetical protein BU15DRAFT_71023 [Melanogaster broomeanus]